jgi:alanine racemase
MARLLNREAHRQNRRVLVHLKADTGMGRLGLPPERLLDVAVCARPMEGLEILGAFTHCPECGAGVVAGQLHLFRTMLDSLRNHGIRPRLRHMANSGTLFNHRSTHFDMVRPGLALYGVDGGDLGDRARGLLPALSVRTQIVFLKTVEAGAFIGYRPGFRTWRETRIATLPVGYADGYATALCNRARVLVRGAEAPVAGRISMDYTTVDVGHVEGVREGDTVTLLGRDAGASISACDLAAAAGTIPYEILTMLSARRVPKVFTGCLP